MPRLNASFTGYSTFCRLPKSCGFEHRYRKTCIALGFTAILLFATLNSAVALEASALAQQFRAKWPWHLQIIIYAFADSGGGIHFLVSEPPDFLTPSSEKAASLASVLKTTADVKWFKTRRGMNGWVQDLVISATFRGNRTGSENENHAAACDC